MKALVTGDAGFVGKHLVNLLLEEGMVVRGIDLRNGQDIRDYEYVRDTIDAFRPDYIFHLAGQAFVPESLNNPQRTFEVNTLGAINIFEAVRQLGLKCKIQVAGSSEEYGPGKNKETDVLQPKSPYAVSKAAMDLLGMVYAKTYNMNIVVTRAFNHTGPGRGEMYAESSFAKQIVEIEQGKREVLEHGDLSSVRNYTDVRDTVRAYRKAIDLPSGQYNICSKSNVTMETVLFYLKANAKVDIKDVTNPALGRPNDFSFKKPSSLKLRKLTGWKPEIPLYQTLSDLLDYWRDESCVF